MIGPNGNSIDIPLNGAYCDWGFTDKIDEDPGTPPFDAGSIGCYWTASSTDGMQRWPSIYKSNSNVYRSYAMVCNSELGDLTGKAMFMLHLRAFHMAIRPVKSKS